MAGRILIVTWEYPPVVEGGLARHVRKLAEQLVAQGREVHVLTRGGRSTQPQEDRHGVIVHRVAEPEWPKDDLQRFVAWVGHMNDDLLARGATLGEALGFDVVHGHDWLVAVAAKRLADRLRIPFVATVHATEHGRRQGWVHEPPMSEIHRTERWMVHVADQVIACSHYMRRHVAEVFDLPEARVAVIPNGVDAAELRPSVDLAALRARFAAPDERLVLLVGRLVYEKGFQHALEALPEVIDRVGGVRFLMAGSGPHEAQLREQADELGLMAHGAFLGWLGDDRLHALYRIADLCVVPSIYEPFGLVVLEAMASSCPCIVADTGGLREIVPDTTVGLRFPARDAKSLAVAMERVLTDDVLRAGLVAEAAEHVRRFDWADVAQRTGALYEELAGAAV
ncbi:MAG: glycosyltransferase family 4 protein [Solirubrobacteraceae bacterium]